MNSPFFHYINRQLHAEDVTLSRIIKDIPTPFFCYSQTAIETSYQEYSQTLKGLDATVCYALKANSNQAILISLAQQGSGADVVSMGELMRALKAGIPPKKIVFSGVGKTAEEISYALKKSILQINIESLAELEHVNAIAGKMNLKAPIALRINPHVDAQTHAKITTGKAENKFGIDWTKAHQAYETAAQLPHIQIQGITMHIGSQLMDLKPFEQAFTRLKTLIESLEGKGINIKVLDLGGGLGIQYDDTSAPCISEYGNLLKRLFQNSPYHIICEPGRRIAGNAGILVTQILYEKKGQEKNFMITDAGMNDLIRPTLYEAYHDIVPIKFPEKQHQETITADVVGPICETGDTFGYDRNLPPMQAGDHLAILSSGAYGSVMASNYNTRGLCAEILVKNNQFHIIRPHQSIEEMIFRDQVPPWLLP